MSRVHILTPEVISKIAAGEVIERPASVLKELIENSIDAGADDIKIRLEDAGKKLIFIRDNGSGIDKADLETIFLRHTTSKIKSIDDLFNIHSLGFRGEALYSVAAIADVVLRSRPAGQDTGWEIHMRAGKKMNLKPVTMQPGTEIEVRELFFNTPARRKFLKSNTTEITQILNTLVPYCLFYPQKRFSCSHEKKDLLDLAPDQYPAGRMAHALNLNEKHLIEAQKGFPESNVSLRMILGDINIKRSRRDLQFVFINGRPVQSKSVSFHMNQIYQLIFPPQAYPAFCVFLDIPPSEIDVNIHPTKREVKIREEQPLMSAVRRMCESALMSQGKAQQVEGRSLGEGIPADKIIMGPQELPRSFVRKLDESEDTPSFLDRAFASSSPMEEYGGHLFNENKNNLQVKLAAARYIGSFIKKFLIFESGDNLLIVDQHAAQERILYEKLKKQIEAGNVEIQSLLTPILVNLTAQEMLLFEESQATLEESGLTCTQFDPSTIAIHSHPQLLKNPEATVRYFLSEGSIKRFDHSTIARQACRSSVMAGDNMNKEQAEYQRDQLLTCADPFTCPHGRPTVIEMSEGFLDKQFLRT